MGTTEVSECRGRLHDLMLGDGQDHRPRRAQDRVSAGRRPTGLRSWSAVSRSPVSIERMTDMAHDDYEAANRANWDERVAPHLIGYGADEFAADPSAISHEVRTDLRLMAPYLPDGSIEGLRLLHLQCHIGTDTLSWARLGADVTGLDFSAPAIAAARDLATRAGLDAAFVESTVDDAAGNLDGQ